MNTDSMPDKLVCSNPTVTAADAAHLEAAGPSNVETTADALHGRPGELFEGGLGI